MIYKEGVHGIFRNHTIRPSYESIRSSERDLIKENAEYQEVIDRDRAILLPIILGMIGFAITMSAHQENIAMTIAALAVAIVMIIMFKNKSHPFFPKPDKNPVINVVIVVVTCLIVIGYNVMCLNGMISNPTPEDNANALLIAIGWVGISTFITELAFGIKRNTKCSETAEVCCIGYTDIAVHRKNHHNRVLTTCVYELNHNGETYYILGNKKSSFQETLTPIGFTELARYNPENPGFCMVKKCEIAAFVKAILIGGLCCTLAFVGLKTNMNRKALYPESSRVPTIIEPDNKVNVATTEYIDITSAETTETTVETTIETEPEIIGYTDEKITEITGNSNFYALTYPVVEIDGEYAYFGEVPGLVSSTIPRENLEVGDEVLFIFDESLSYWKFKLEEGESYLGERSPEKLNMLTEDGRFILTDDFVKSFFGDNFKVTEWRFARKTNTKLFFSDGDYEYEYDLLRGTDIYYWNYEPNERIYLFEGSKYSCLGKADLYAFPE